MSVVPQSQPPSYQESQLLNQASPPSPHSPSPSSSIGATIITIQQPSESDSAEVKVIKQAIYSHPLFPLMAALFEKCESVTHSPDLQVCDTCDEEIRSFIHMQEKENKPLLSGDEELDELMVKAIQVLRIHLLELEKVNDLCKDFCTRYINCLKSKLHNENLLRMDSLSDESPPPPNPHHSPVHTAAPVAMQQMMGQGVVTSIPGGVVFQQPPSLPVSGVSMATISQGQIISGNTVYQMVQTPQGIVAQPIQVTEMPQAVQQQMPTTVIHGGTPLSQIGVISPVTSQMQQASTAVPTTPTLSDSGLEDDDTGKKKNKRGVLPKHATQVMKTWLFQHIVHPYPNEEEKRVIAAETKLSLLQVNNWFINARRRILQPMLDATNPQQNKAKKSKPNTRPLQRFWPDSIANIRPQAPHESSSDFENQGDSMENDNDESEDLEDEQEVVSHQQQNMMPVLTYMTADGQLFTPGSMSIVTPLQGGATPLLHVHSGAPSSPSPTSSPSDNSQSQADPGAGHSDNSD